MDEEMDQDFIVECLDVSEMDPEYEFDAARFFDFCRPESSFDSQQAERWFLTAGNYPPSPLIIKLKKKEITSHGLQQGKTKKSKSNNSHIPPLGSPSKSKIKGTISNVEMAYDICKTKPKPRSPKVTSSTLMKPTASHLAKQRFQKTSDKVDATSSQNFLASDIATKRQKLEIGYLLKLAHLKHQRLLSHKISRKDTSTISKWLHPKSEVTVSREPELETLQRAERRMFNKDSKSSAITKVKTQMLKARPLNRNILKAPALPPLRKTGAPLPEIHLSSSSHANSAARNGLVDFKRPSTQKSVKQGKSVSLLKTRSHKCDKLFPSREDNGIAEDTGQESTNTMESKPIFDKKNPAHPPIELLNKLSLRFDKEAREMAQPKKTSSAKELKENAPNYLQLKFRKCVGKTNHCAAERGTPGIGLQTSMNRSLGIR